MAEISVVLPACRIPSLPALPHVPAQEYSHFWSVLATGQLLFPAWPGRWCSAGTKREFTRLEQFPRL